MLYKSYKILLKGIFFGLGMVFIFGGYLVVVAVAPGETNNPSFAPADDNVVIPPLVFNYWESPTYGYSFSDPASNVAHDLGVHKWCALGRLTHDGVNGGTCNVYKVGSNWYLQIDKWQGGGIWCRANCID